MAAVHWSLAWRWTYCLAQAVLSTCRSARVVACQLVVEAEYSLAQAVLLAWAFSLGALAVALGSPLAALAAGLGSLSALLERLG